MSAATFWNGEPCEARRVSVVIADAPEFARYWARGLVGQRRNAVEIIYGNETFYLDNEAHGEGTTDDAAWRKVTLGHGSPRYGHRDLSIVPGSARSVSVGEGEREQTETGGE